MSRALESCLWVATQVARGWRRLLTALRGRGWRSSSPTRISGSLADGVTFALHSQAAAMPDPAQAPDPPWLSPAARQRLAAGARDLHWQSRSHFETGSALRPLAGIAGLGVVVTTLVHETGTAERSGVHLVAVTPEPCILGEPPRSSDPVEPG